MSALERLARLEESVNALRKFNPEISYSHMEDYPVAAMEECEDGEYVRHVDISTLPGLIAALREAVTALEKSNEAMNTCMDHCDGLGFTVMQTYDSPKIGAAHLSVRTALATIENLLKP